MMSIDRLELGSNIRNYIELNNSLELAGIGRLVRKTLNTQVNSASNTIVPGSSVIELENCNVNVDNGFVNYLSQKSNISISSAKDLYKKFCAELNFDLEVNGLANLYGFGKFLKKGRYTTFQSNESSISSANYGLPMLTLKPLSPLEVMPKESKVQQPPLKTINTSTKRDLSDRNFLINTAAVAALFMLLVFSYHYYWPNKTVNHFSELKVDQNRLNKAPEKLLVSGKINPELIPGFVEEEKKNISSCALIIGSFAKRANAFDIQQKVIEAGYELFTEEYNDLYRVGISVPCEEVQGRTFRQIEERLGIDPWLRLY